MHTLDKCLLPSNEETVILHENRERERQTDRDRETEKDRHRERKSLLACALNSVNIKGLHQG